MLKAEGFDKAIIGQTYDMAVQEERLIYSFEKIVAILVARDRMTSDEALEYIEFNIEGAYVGEQTPIFVDFEGGK